MAVMKKNLILNDKQIAYKIKRIAHQIVESNTDEKEIILAGITGNGFLLARKILKCIAQISPEVKIRLCEVFIEKENPLKAVTTSLPPEDYALKALVLIDDVLHTGTTLMYGVKHFLDVPLKRFKTAILVNRNHKKYPVKADFKGISLSTSIQENAEVIFDKHKGARVFLKNV